MHALVAPYALDALDARERAMFEDHLETCEPCRVELVGFVATAERLAEFDRRAPRADVRARVLAAARSLPQERAVVVALPRRVRRALPRMLVASAVLIGAVAAGGFAVERDHAHDIALTSNSISSVLAAPDASTKAQAFDHGGNVRLVASATRDVAVIAANDLPVLSGRRVYQVWKIKGDTSVSQGMFRSGSTMVMHELKGSDRIAVTVEPRGGSTEPTTLPVVAFAI